MADLGKVSVTVESEPYQNKAYEKQTFVSYDDSTWISVQDVPSGQAPAEGSTYWLLIASNKASRIGTDSTHRFVTDTEKTTWNNKAGTNNATTSSSGLMSAADKAKLNGIQEGAQTRIGAPVYISATAPTVQAGEQVLWVKPPTT